MATQEKSYSQCLFEPLPEPKLNIASKIDSFVHRINTFHSFELSKIQLSGYLINSIGMTVLYSPLATEAAQIIATTGVNWNDARKTLLENHPNLFASSLPNDEEIETALREHYSIFDKENHSKRLYELRSIALIVMKELSSFSPLLSKGVLNGCADKYSNIYIDLISEDPKEIELFLLDREIDFESYPVERSSRKDPISELIVDAPSIKNGIFEKEKITPLIVLRIHDENFVKKIKKRQPDRWQIEEEACNFASIKDLEKLLALTQ